MFTRSKTRALSLLLLFIFLFVPIAGAVSNAGNINANLHTASKNHNTDDGLLAELNAKVELYNQNFDKIPAVVKQLVGSEQIAGKIKLENGKMLYLTSITNEGKIEAFSESDPKSKFKPSITVKTNEKTVRKVLDSKDPFKEAIKCLKDKSVKVETKGFFKKTALWTLKESDK